MRKATRMREGKEFDTQEIVKYIVRYAKTINLHLDRLAVKLKY